MRELPRQLDGALHCDPLQGLSYAESLQNEYCVSCVHAGSHMQNGLLQAYAVTDIISSQIQHGACASRLIWQR